MGLAPEIWVIVLAIALFAGVVKGVVGFAMPMVMISGFASIMPPDAAVAALIVPTLVTNIWQALRQGLAPAQASIREHWRYLAVLCGMILISAQLVPLLPQAAMFLILGVPVTLFAISQLLGWQLQFGPHLRRRAELIIGAVAGFLGGVSGVWGPPTVAYLTALNTEKLEQIRVQGVVYGLGGVVLTIAHVQSGILNTTTAPLSVTLLGPALLGMFLGFKLQDRMNQNLFKQATLLVLVVAGLNLVRRGVLGL